VRHGSIRQPAAVDATATGDRTNGLGPHRRARGGGPERRFSARRKLAAVTRLLRGEPLETLARELNVTVARLSTWRDRALVAAEAAVKECERDGRDEELLRLKDEGAGSWSRVERIIARVEAGAQGPDTRFVVTSLPDGSARALYERSYCRRGQAENHVKAWKRMGDKRPRSPLPPMP
jgi:hypothetical protein